MLFYVKSNGQIQQEDSTLTILHKGLWYNRKLNSFYKSKGRPHV
ncbi:hypothetical protein BN1088_1432993 [Sphingobacterium sp. PM2-P1-29]|nr:hypothetical protein BN1088_1432993 [Sphingobacterium sp. PM2-P1-29]